MMLRPRQSLLVERTIAALDEHGNTLAVAPTGSGKTIKDSSYFPITECESGLVIRKKFLKVYLEERLAEYLALGGLNELIKRVPLVEAGHKLPDSLLNAYP